MDLGLRVDTRAVTHDRKAPMNRLRRFDHLTFLHITDEVTEGLWLNHRGDNYTDIIIWDPEITERSNSEDRDYIAVKGDQSVIAQAFTASETGPDILCARYNKPWNFL